MLLKTDPTQLGLLKLYAGLQAARIGNSHQKFALAQVRPAADQRCIAIGTEISTERPTWSPKNSGG